jgi:hypothetical protein
MARKNSKNTNPPRLEEPIEVKIQIKTKFRLSSRQKPWQRHEQNMFAGANMTVPGQATNWI